MTKKYFVLTYRTTKKKGFKLYANRKKSKTSAIGVGQIFDHLCLHQ